MTDAERAQIIGTIAASMMAVSAPVPAPEALAYMAADLDGYDCATVQTALNHCRRELSGRLTLADIIARIPDGRRGPEESWAAMPRDEGSSVVWTAEERESFFAAAYPLLQANDPIAARRAYLEAYGQRLQQARRERRAIRYEPSLGHDLDARARCLEDAAARGLLPIAHAQALLPYQDAHPATEVAALMLARPMPAPEAQDRD